MLISFLILLAILYRHLSLPGYPPRICLCIALHQEEHKIQHIERTVRMRRKEGYDHDDGQNPEICLLQSEKTADIVPVGQEHADDSPTDEYGKEAGYIEFQAAFCIGRSPKERRAGQLFDIVHRQPRSSVNGVTSFRAHEDAVDAALERRHRKIHDHKNQDQSQHGQYRFSRKDLGEDLLASGLIPLIEQQIQAPKAGHGHKSEAGRSEDHGTGHDDRPFHTPLRHIRGQEQHSQEREAVEEQMRDDSNFKQLPVQVSPYIPGASISLPLN